MCVTLNTMNSFTIYYLGRISTSHNHVEKLIVRENVPPIHPLVL